MARRGGRRKGEVMAAADLIERYMAHLRERSCTPQTIDSYTYQLERADKILPFGLDASTEQEIRAWIWSGDLAPASRALTHSALGGFFRWAYATGELDFDPTDGIPRPKVPAGIPRVASDDQVEMLVGYACQPYRLWAILAAYGGLRCIEVYRQRREEITEDEMRIYGKGNKYRVVPTHEVLWTAVKDLPAGPLTSTPSGRRISTNFQRYCVKSHIPMSLHPLRAWFATTMYRATKDLQSVQRLLGHANLATTARYLGLGQQELRAAISALPTLGASAGVATSPVVRSALRQRLLGGTGGPAGGGPGGRR